MSMPLIVSMALLIFAVARGGLGKAEVAIRGRSEAWSAPPNRGRRPGAADGNRPGQRRRDREDGV